MSATSAHQADGGTRPADSQLTLRFFALVDGMRRKPPERALWRELLNLAIGDVRAFVHGSRPVAASAIWSVGWTLYGRADEAGIVEGFSVSIIAADSRLGERTVRGAVALLRQWRVLKMERPSRRAPARWRMNLGGLDWPAVRARAERERTRPSAVTMTGLSAVMVTALKGYNVELPIFDPNLAAGTPRVCEPDRRRQEQQPSPEGKRLIDALAGRSREHDLPFAEDAVRRRLTEGGLTNVDLRRRLNQLPPRLATLTAEQWAADEAAGRVDRCRKGGYPAPPDDPRFTSEDDPESEDARRQRRAAADRRQERAGEHGD